MNVEALTDDEVIELQDQLVLRAASIQVSPAVESTIRGRLATLDEDRKSAITWEDALRQLQP